MLKQAMGVILLCVSAHAAAEPKTKQQAQTPKKS